jgi:DDE_Tnp_1-associated
MTKAPAACAAFDETVVFLSYFKDLKDPRQQGKVAYPLDEILLLCLLAVLAGAETMVDVAGYFAYHAVPTNTRSISAFRYHVIHMWLKSLRRRSQRQNMPWERMNQIIDA